jgi:predicted CoA-binding protein
MPLQTDDELRQILETAKTVAVVGYSNKPDRPSYEITQALKSWGYKVFPVNPTIQSTPEVPVYASLADIPEKVDVVDVFRRAEDVPGVVEEAIQIGAKTVWMQLGIVSDEAANLAEAAGLKVVMDHCIKVEHKRLIHE